MRINSNLPVMVVATVLALGACRQSSDDFSQSVLPPPEVEQAQEKKSKQLPKSGAAQNDIKKPTRIENASVGTHTHLATQLIEQLSREVLAILSNSAITKKHNSANSWRATLIFL